MTTLRSPTPSASSRPWTHLATATVSTRRTRPAGSSGPVQDRQGIIHVGIAGQSKWILAITYNCLKSLFSVSRARKKLLTLAFTRQPSRRAMFPKPSRAWRSSLIELTQWEKAMREKTSSLLFKGEFSKECKIVWSSSMTYFQGSKGQQVGFCAGSDPFKEFRMSRAADSRKKFEAIPLSPCQIR